VVYLFAGTPQQVAAEIDARRRKPRAILISPSTDPFPPLAAVQAEAARLVPVLAERGVDAWFMTRGYIRPSPLQILAAHRERVKVTVGLTTLNRALQRVLEPLAAPPQLRLRQITQLRALGIPVRAAVEPLIPGVTDTRSNLSALLDALASVGVRHITTSYLFLRPAIGDNLRAALEPLGCADVVCDAFKEGPTLKTDALAPRRYLPKARRQHGYAALMAMAAGVGITVRIDAFTNPDFQPPRPPVPPVGCRQLLLSCF
jgi:DNA repair photolyase